MSYTARFPNISIEKKFWKDLSVIPKKIQQSILAAIKSLEHEPRPFGAKSFKQLTPPIELFRYVAQYRIRVESYRILYDVDDDLRVVWIFAVRRRNEKTYK